MVICEVVLAHFQDHIFDEQGKIDPFKIDTVARMGGDWYCRANGDALFEIEKPVRNKGIGVDAIPAHIRLSVVLTGNHLGKLGNVETLPSAEAIAARAASPGIQDLKLRLQQDEEGYRYHLHLLAKDALDAGRVQEAWEILLQK